VFSVLWTYLSAVFLLVYFIWSFATLETIYSFPLL
jgi:hypothetical protein